MKLLIIKLIFLITPGFTALEIETYLSQFSLPIVVKEYSFGESGSLKTFGDFLYILKELKLGNLRTKFIWILDPLTDLVNQYSGGEAELKGTVAVVYDVPNYNKRNIQVTAHEAAHTLGAKHNTDFCNLMNTQPCGELFNSRSKKEVYRAQYKNGNLKNKNFRKLMRQVI